MTIYNILLLSFKISLVAVLIQTIPAILVGWYLARSNSKLKILYNSLLLLPLVLTPIVIGYFVLQLFHPSGIIGNLIGKFDIDIIFNWKGAVIAVCIVSFPLYAQSVQIAVSALPKKFEILSSSLGQSPWQTFLKVTLPLIKLGILRGALLSFSRNMGEFGATVVVAGIIPTQTETVASAIFRALSIPNQESKLQLLIFISIALSLTFIFFIQWLEFLKRRDWNFSIS